MACGLQIHPVVKCSYKHIQSRRGFTLTEIMVVIVIMGIVLVASIPAMGRFMQSWRLSGEIDHLAGFLRGARSSAIMKNRDVIFKFQMSDGTYFYFEDTDSDGVRDGDEYQSATYALEGGISIDTHTLSSPILIFGSRGNTNEGGTITLRNTRANTRTVSIFGGTGAIRAD